MATYASENRQRALAAYPKDGQSGEGECPTPDTPHGGTRYPPPSPPVPPPRRTTPAHKSVHCEVGDRPLGPPPPRPRETVSGPQLPGPKMGSWGRDNVEPRTSHREARIPRLAPSCCPYSAQRQLTRAWAAVLVTGPETRRSLRPRKTSSGPRPPAPRNVGWGRENAKPGTCHK